MILSILVLLLDPVPCSGLQEIPIEVLSTWQIDYASDIQDIAYVSYPYALAIRSNGDGRIYLADAQCNYLDEITLPESVGGFGLTYNSYDDMYFINSLQNQIYYSDGSDSWASFPHSFPGAGMDFLECFSPEGIYEVSPFSPYRLCFTDLISHENNYYDMAGTGLGEITGLTVGVICTLDDWPCALIATTRNSNEFLFYMYDSSEYELVAVEDCPITVEESLGLSRSWDCTKIYWSYKGTDGKYYVSLLNINFFYFGQVEDEASPVGEQSYLWIESNPASGNAIFNLHVPVCNTVSLTIYDISGRFVKEAYRGPLEAGDTQWSFSAPLGMYTVILRYGDEVESLKFMIID